MNRKPETYALPWVFQNGRIVPARTASISIFDRSFQMGDGVFATMRIIGGWPVQWGAHWRRFAGTARYLGIRMPLSAPACQRALQQLLRRNRQPDAIARIHLSRGVGPRGYSPQRAKCPTLLICLYPPPTVATGLPSGVRVGLSSYRIGKDETLSQHKTASRILHVLAKAEADLAGWDDVLLLDASHRVLEATSSNFFWFRGQTLITPSLDSGILAGTTRATVMTIAKRMKIRVREAASPLRQVIKSSGAFLTVSTRGILEVLGIAGRDLPRNPLTAELQRRLESLWQLEARTRRRSDP